LTTSPQIKLRKVELDDAPIILKWENTPEFWAITENIGPFEMKDILEFIKQSNDLILHGQQRYMILDKEDKPIGAVDLFGYNKQQKSAGMGILIADPINRKRGFAYSAISLVINELKKTDLISQLHCIIHQENTPSIKLFTRHGFEKMGHELFKGREVIRYTKNL
jgi:diamine N-acetyltransferase